MRLLSDGKTISNRETVIENCEKLMISGEHSESKKVKRVKVVIFVNTSMVNSP
jgi:hypothetical protein